MNADLDPYNLRLRLYGMLRSSSFALTDADRATALVSAIEELIGDCEVALRPEPDRMAAKALPKHRGKFAVAGGKRRATG